MKRVFWSMMVLLGVVFAHNLFAGPKDLYSVKINRIDGKSWDLSELKGHPVLFVNVASRCGFTKQYAGLEALYDAYKDRGLVVAGVPSNSFKQELSNEEMVRAYCERTYGVSFPMSEIVSVRGDDMHDLYRVLMEQLPKGADRISWNFNKVLVDGNGNVVRKFGSRVEPDDEVLLGAIENLLK